MRIWINHIEGVGCRVKTTGINISAKLTVRDLKCIVAEKLRKVVNSFYLVYNKNGFRVLLTDTFTLKFFDMKRVSVVNVVDLPQKESKDSKRMSVRSFKPVLESIPSNELLDSQHYSQPQAPKEESKDQVIMTRKRSQIYSDQNIIPNQFIYNLLEQSIEASKNGEVHKIQQVVLTLRSVAKEPAKLFNMTDGNGWTCLHYACIGGHVNAVKLLLSYGVCVNLETNNHWLPIQLVASIGNLECLEQLLKDSNIQINKMTKNRGPALHIATELGFVECVSALLSRNAARSIEDYLGRRPSIIASNSVILNMLKDASSTSSSSSSSTICMKGTAYYTTSLFLHDYEVFLNLNIEKGTLERYKKEADWIEGRDPAYKILLINVQEVIVEQQVKGNEICHYFFILKVKNKKYKYYTLTKDRTQQWVNEIKVAIDYCHTHSKLFQSKIDGLSNEDQKIESIVEIDPSLTINVVEIDPSLTIHAVEQTTEIKPQILETEEIHYITPSEIQPPVEEAVKNIAAHVDEVPEVKESTHEDHPPQPELKEPVTISQVTPAQTAHPLESASSHPLESAPSHPLESASSHPLESSPAYSPSEPSNSDVEMSLNSFITEELIGTGSFGRVHRVKHKATGKVFAIKALNKRFLQKQNLLKYAISECKILKDLSHPFILSLHYAFQDNSEVYMVLDYCPNRDLEFLISQLEKLPEDDVRFYAAEVLCALQYLHERDTVYRDLKPANILIAEDGHIKLADFGLAKEGVKDVRAATTFAGTPVYMAPEIMHGYGYGKSADIYSLGVLIYELLAGVPPYNHADPLQLYKLIEKADLNIPKHFSKSSKDLVKKLLNKMPGKRLTFQDIKKHAFFKGVDWPAYPLKKQKVPVTSFLAKEFIAASNYKDDPDYANF